MHMQVFHNDYFYILGCLLLEKCMRAFVKSLLTRRLGDLFGSEQNIVPLIGKQKFNLFIISLFSLLTRRVVIFSLDLTLLLRFSTLISCIFSNSIFT